MAGKTVTHGNIFPIQVLIFIQFSEIIVLEFGSVIGIFINSDISIIIFSENSFDKIEDLTQCLNFLFYLINFYLKSKGLLVPSDETIRTIIKTLDNLYNKLNTLIFSLNESKDETSEIQKSKIYIALNLISNVENIVKHINK